MIPFGWGYSFSRFVTLLNLLATRRLLMAKAPVISYEAELSRAETVKLGSLTSR